MGNSKLFCVVVLAVAVMAALPGSGSAGTLSYSSSISMPSDWSGDLSVQKFDPNMGTLDSVTVQLTGSVSTALTIGNVSNQFGTMGPSSGTASTETTFTASDATLGLSPLTVAAGAPFSGLAAGHTLTNVPAVQSNSNTYTFTDPSALSEFSGSGMFSLPTSTSTQTSLTYGGGVTYAASASDPVVATEWLSVGYTFTPVPEPSTIALLAVGAIGLLGCIWRTRF